MSLFKSGATLSIISKRLKSAIFSSCLCKNSPVSRPASTVPTNKRNDPDEDDELNKPIKFSTSPAAKWKASISRSGERVPRLWYEPYVVLASLGAFMVYFMILREENDIDQELSRSLYSRIEGLEEQQLRLSLEYNKEHGLGVSDIESRLTEIREEKHSNTH